MIDATATADRIEEVLKVAVSAASGASAAPRDYFVLFDRSKGDCWFLGFLFQSRDVLREALEDGTCFWIHNYVAGLIGSAEPLKQLQHYVVFDFGELPKEKEQRSGLYDKHQGALQSLRQERASKEFETCGLCGHSVNEHQMRGFTEEGEIAPSQGWMICPHESCLCFRTWSMSGGSRETEAQ